MIDLSRHKSILKRSARIFFYFWLFASTAGCINWNEVWKYKLEHVDLSCEKWKTLQSGAFNYSIDYPQGWTALTVLFGNHGDKEVIAILAPPDSTLPVVEIARRDYSSSWEEIQAWGKERVQGFYHDAKIEFGDATTLEINGNVLYERMHKIDDHSGELIVVKDVYVKRAQDSLIFSLKALSFQYDQTNSCFEKMMQSLNW